jgi:hypothetical protein
LFLKNKYLKYEMRIDTIVDTLRNIDSSNNMRNLHVAIALINNKPIIKPTINHLVDSGRGSVHAEVDALYNVCKRYVSYFSRKSLRDIDNLKQLKNVDLIVIRISKNGDLKNSKPCIDCLKILKKAKCNRIYYSDENGQITMEKIKHMKSTHICCFKRNLK